MIEARSFVEAAKLAGFSLYTGVPCSYVKPFINYVIDAPDLSYIGAAKARSSAASTRSR
jgi:phosphonopyruvate decarboxylase